MLAHELHDCIESVRVIDPASGIYRNCHEVIWLRRGVNQFIDQSREHTEWQVIDTIVTCILQGMQGYGFPGPGQATDNNQLHFVVFLIGLV
jgi:hypothetical protein